uniref:OSJNBb0085H11.2 protein n=1 Tax=Oryza sativa subsp. japonica TaxID=39947 RepID=Q7XNT5_ORYSJ|nr:OSJNBb0085H11.2 [Oryza sativa Japonica Group]
MAKSSSFGRYSSPCTLRLGRLWLTRTTPRLSPFLLHSLRHGFQQIWSKGLMPSANKPLTGKGENGASAETVHTMWYGTRRPLSTDAPAETYIVPANKRFLTPQVLRPFSSFANAYTPFAMAPRKPKPALAKGPDPGRVDDDSTAFLGVSHVDDVELANLVSSGALVEGQAFAPGKAVVPKPIDNRTVVFAVFFEAGLRFPCNVLLPEILRLFQLSPSALVRIFIFEWACRTSGFEPSAELFGAIFFATVNSKMVITPAGTKKTVFGSVNFNVRPEWSDLWPVNAAMSKWDHHWMARWFFHTIPFEAGSDSAKALRCRRRAIAPNRKPKIAVDGAMEARFVLLRKVCSCLSCRDLVEEFCMLRIFPLSQSWQVTVDQDEEIDGLPKLVLLEGMNMLTLDQAEAEARRMIGDVSVVKYSELLTRQAAGRANWVYNSELPPRANPHKADDDAGPSRKRTRGQVKLVPRKRRVPASSDSDADDEDHAEEHDGEEEGEEEEEVEAVAKRPQTRRSKTASTPLATLLLQTGVESNSSPLRRKDVEGAKALVAFSSSKAAKGGPVKKISKKKGLVDIARVFSDDESSDETPTSPAGRSLDLSIAPILPLGANGAGSSAITGASASAERIMMAAARVFGSPLREPAISPLVKTKGKGAAAEASASEYSLAAPHFAPGDFETRADLIPFVEGVSNLVLPASTPSLFTELNEFDEGCSAIKSLVVRNLEMEALANTLKEAKAEIKRLQSELEKGKKARAEVDCLKAKLEKGREAIAEVDRLQAELKEEKAHSAVLTDYYNLTEPKMEALRLKVSKAEASVVDESQRFSREMAKTIESARTACQTLRLALTDMGAKVRGVSAEDASAFDFSEWTQQAGGSVSDCATTYGNCCARVSAAFTLGLLQQFVCEHVAEFPNYAKGDWEISAQNITPALRAWRKQFWQKDGPSAAKARLLEQLAKAEAADRSEEEDMAGEEGGGDAQDHPEGVRRKSCIRPPSGSWRSQNEKFVALKGLPKVRCPFWPFYREMEINSRSYKVFKVAGWLRAYPRRTLEDYDLVHSRRLEDMARFWRNHQKTNRQEAISQCRYSLVSVSPPTPLRVVYDISSDDEPSSPDHSLGRDSDYGGEDVIYL